MCDLLPSCQDSDDPVALALLQSKRPARLEVRCPVRRHRLAAVYDLPGHGGMVYAHRASRELLSHVFGLNRDDLDTSDGQAYMHGHAALIPLDELEARGGAGVMTLRCRCGSFDVDGPSCARRARIRSSTTHVVLATRRP